MSNILDTPFSCRVNSPGQPMKHLKVGRRALLCLCNNSRKLARPAAAGRSIITSDVSNPGSTWTSSRFSSSLEPTIPQLSVAASSVGVDVDAEPSPVAGNSGVEVQASSTGEEVQGVAADAPSGVVPDGQPIASTSGEPPKFETEAELCEAFNRLWDEYEAKLLAAGYFSASGETGEEPGELIHGPPFAIGAVKRANLAFARARPDILYSLPKDKIRAAITPRLPYTDRKVGVLFLLSFLFEGVGERSGILRHYKEVCGF